MTEVSKAPVPHATVVREKPLMNVRQILLMPWVSSASSTASGCSRPR
jgi:hypothetical protein